MKRTRRKFTAEFKAQVCLEAIKERESLADLAKRFEIHPNLIAQWKREFLDNAAAAFGAIKSEEKSDTEQEKLYSKIGRLEMENDFLKKSLKKTGL